MTTYYVRKSGSDGAAGTSPAAAWLTIDHAANTVAAGDTVYIGAGVYRELVTMDTAGSSGHIISYVADIDGSQTGDAGLVILSAFDSPAQGANRQGCLDLNDGKTFLTFRHLVFEGSQFTTSGSGPVFDTTTAHNSYEAVTFDGCVFIATGASAGYMYGLALDYNNGAAPTGATGLSVQNCVLMGGINLANDNNVTAHVNVKATIQNNIILAGSSSERAINSLPGSSANTYSLGGVTIKNNTIIGNGTIRFTSAKNTTNPITIVNNAFLCAPSNCIDGASSTAGAIAEGYNIAMQQSSTTTFVTGTTATNLGPDLPTSNGFFLGGLTDWPLRRVFGWSPYAPFEAMPMSPALGAASGTYAPATDALGNVRPANRHLVPCRMDGSDAAVSDPNSKWSSDANAVSYDPTTFASSSTQGSTASNYLMAEGSSFPGDGATVQQVRARVLGYVQNANNRLDVVLTSDAAAETLATISVTNQTPAAWTAWATVTPPTGGWTAAQVQALEFKAFKQDGNAGNVYLAYIELEITCTGSDAGAVQSRARPVQEATIYHAGAASLEFAGAGYHDMLVPVAAASTVISVWAYRDASYAGDNPILEILNVPGYADQNDTQAGAAAEWEQLSCTIVPTAAGWCRVRLRSRDTSAVGKCYFDDLAVA